MMSLDSVFSDNDEMLEESTTDYLPPPGTSSIPLFDSEVTGNSLNIASPVKKLEKMLKTPEPGDETEDDNIVEIDMVERDYRNGVRNGEVSDGQDLDYDSFEDSDKAPDSPTIHEERSSRRLFHIPSLESISTVPEQGGSAPSQSSVIAEVYAELQLIHLKLKSESKLMQRREYELHQKEKKVARAEARIEELVDKEIKRRRREYEEQSQSQLFEMEQVLRDKIRENNRLKDNFETLKQANDLLRKQLNTLTSLHEKLEKQHLSVQARLTNLQRKHDYKAQQNEADRILAELQQPSKKAASTVKPAKTKPAKVPANTYDVISNLLEWLSEAKLRNGFIDQPKQFLDELVHDVDEEILQGKCMKLLPSLVEILRDCPRTTTKVYLPFLQFIYWSLLHMDRAQGSQKTNLSSTVRRLGEELYRPRHIWFSADTEGGAQEPLSPGKAATKEGSFFRSPNLHIRFLSSLIILKTLSQVDHLAHVFDSLKVDLKDDEAKELFIHYHATPVILSYFKPVNKAFIGSAVDIFLQMTMDVVTLQPFLDSCSNENWFRACSVTLKKSSVNMKIIEQLSIILQKLSKMKCNKKFFDIYGMTSSIQDLYRDCSADHAFLNLNLRSILLNLNVKVPLLD